MDPMECSESISSEGSANDSAMCNVKHRHISQQPLWDKEEVILALTNLPAGEAALAVLPTLCGEMLDQLVELIKGKSIEQTADLSLLIPRFANGYAIHKYNIHLLCNWSQLYIAARYKKNK